MKKRSKKYEEAFSKIEKGKVYSKEEAVKLVKETSISKFDGSVEVAMRLNLDTKKADQQLRGAIVLPKGTGKNIRVLVIAKGENAEKAKNAGADDVGDVDMIEKIEKECLRLNAAWHGKKAKQVPVIPDEPVLDEFIELDAVKEQLQSGHLLPIGYDADNANPYALDLHRIFSYLISGRAKTGKKNLLKILMKMGAQTGMKMYVADFSGKLKETAAENNAVFIDTDRKMYDAFMEWQTEIIEKNGRKKEMEAAGKSDLEIYQEMASMGLSCMMISNLPEFINHIMYPEKDVPLMAGFLENITEKGAGLGIYFISAYTPDEITKVKGNAIYNNLVKKKEGLHLGGNVGAQNILNFDYISYKEQNKVQKTGVAMLPSVDGELTSTRLIIPLAGKADAEK